MLSPYVINELAKEHRKESMRKAAAWRMMREAVESQPTQPGLAKRILARARSITKASEQLNETIETTNDANLT